MTWEGDRIFLTREYPRDKARREEIPLDNLPLTGQDAILAEFISAIDEGREPECSGEDNLKSLAIVFASIKSAQEGRAVKIDEVFT